MSVFEHLKNKTNELFKAKESEVQEEERSSELADQLRENLEIVKGNYPQDAENLDLFAKNLLKELAQYESESEEEIAADAAVHFFISEDKMIAYACFFPPLSGGKDINEEMVRTELKYEGIIYGIQEKMLSNKLQNRSYFDIFAIARGTSPQAGKNGKVTDFFPREGEELPTMDEEPTDENPNPFNFIEKGDVICHIEENEKGVDGVDVTGRTLKGEDGEMVEVPRGTNTQLSPDGKKLIAAAGGRIYFKDNKFEIHKMHTIRGNFDESMGPLTQAGDIFVKGDILKDSSLKASGDIIIQGNVLGAEIQAEGSIIVHGKVQARTTSSLKAGGDIHCLEIERADIVCKGSLYAEVVIESTVKCSNNVSLLNGRGLLMSSSIYVGHSLTAKKIGNQANHKNVIYIGWQQEMQEKLQGLQNTYEENKDTLAQIKKTISTFKALPQLSAEKKSVLNQLIEQRKLYEQTEEELENEMKELKHAIFRMTDCSVTCEELYPVLEVSYNDQTVTLNTNKENCRVFLSDGKLISR